MKSKIKLFSVFECSTLEHYNLATGTVNHIMYESLISLDSVSFKNGMIRMDGVSGTASSDRRFSLSANSVTNVKWVFNNEGLQRAQKKGARLMITNIQIRKSYVEDLSYEFLIQGVPGWSLSIYFFENEIPKLVIKSNQKYSGNEGDPMR